MLYEIAHLAFIVAFWGGAATIFVRAICYDPSKEVK